MAKKLLRHFDWAFAFLFRWSGRMLQRLHPEWDARIWSNSELERWGKLVSGSIVNVSGWRDSDKHGRRYADYFSKKTEYFVSNIGGERGSESPEIFLDLTKPLPQELEKRFDVVFNHTTLEHVSNIQQAVSNLCRLSKDVVIVVVPFLQSVHFDQASYLDYWRVTPFGMAELFKSNSFSMIYCTNNDNPVHNIYLFCVAVRDSSKWSAVAAQNNLISSKNIPGECRDFFKLPPIDSVLR